MSNRRKNMTDLQRTDLLRLFSEKRMPGWLNLEITAEVQKVVDERGGTISTDGWDSFKLRYYKDACNHTSNAWVFYFGSVVLNFEFQFDIDATIVEMINRKDEVNRALVNVWSKYQQLFNEYQKGLERLAE